MEEKIDETKICTSFLSNLQHLMRCNEEPVGKRKGLHKMIIGIFLSQSSQWNSLHSLC